jgi:hypothetical protein
MSCQVPAELVQDRGLADGEEVWVSPTPEVWQHRPQPGDRMSVTWGSEN